MGGSVGTVVTDILEVISGKPGVGNSEKRHPRKAPSMQVFIAVGTDLL